MRLCKVMSGVLLCVSGLLTTSTVFAQSFESSSEATLALITTSDSTSINGIHYQVDAFKDESCAKPAGQRKLWRKRYAGPEEQFDEITLPAEAPYYFQVHYKEARRGETRQCTILARFSPNSGVRYQARFETTGQVSACQMSIENLSDPANSVVVEFPEFSCKKVGKPGVDNRTPVHNFLKRF